MNPHFALANFVAHKVYADKSDRLKPILEKAQACLMVDDPLGFKAASIEFLKECFDLSIGETVHLYDWRKPRTVVIKDFELSMSKHTPLKPDETPWVRFYGPCISHKVKASDPNCHAVPVTSACIPDR